MPPITSFPIGNLAGQQPNVHVRDTTSGTDLYERNPDTVYDYIASTSKLMVALVAYEWRQSQWAGNLSNLATVTTADVTQPIPPFSVDFVGLNDADQLSWLDLLYGLLLASAGDCGLCIARLIGTEIFVAAGSTGNTGVTRFVEQMNTRAGTLGLTNSTFTDPYGGGRTPSPTVIRNQSSARDLSKLCYTVMAIPTLRTIAGTVTRGLTITGGRTATVTATMTNRLLNGPTPTQSGISDTSAIGGKDGTWTVTGVDAYSLTAMFRAPNGNEIVCTVLGSISRLCLMWDFRGLMYALPRDYPSLAGTISNDTDFASVQMLVGADGSIVDESTAARSLTVTSVTVGTALVYSPTTPGSGVYNAQSDVVYAADAAALRPGSGNFTVEIWYAGEGTEPSAEYVFFAKGEHTPVIVREWLLNFFSHVFTIFGSPDGFNWTFVTAFAPTSDERATFFNGAIRHIAYVKEGSVWALYLMGERSPVANTLSIASTTGTAAVVSIGYKASAASFQGTFDDFRYTVGVARYSADMVTIDPRAFPRTASPPPPPPPPPGAGQQALSPTYVSPAMPIRQARFARLTPAAKLKITLPREAPVGFDAAAAQTDSYFRPYAHGPRTDGPFRQRLPHYLDFPVFQANPEPDPVVQIYPPLYPAISIHSPASPYPFSPHFRPPAANPYSVVPPSPPELPPPPPPPESGVLGPARNQVPSIPRAPAAEDPRVRPHIDKVATMLNELLRLGYIQQTGRDEYAIIGGGFALPRAPAVTDDRTVGAVLGATFVNTTTQDVYVCVGNSVGSAVWKQIPNS